MATDAAISTIVGKVFDLFIGGATRHIGYLANYGRNIAKLKDEVDKLKAELQKKEREVEIAKQNVEDIEEDVSNWMVSANGTFEEMDRFLQSQEDRIHKRCFKWQCTNPWACYRLGREAVKRLEVVTSKTGEGSKFAKISHARRFEGIAHVTTAKYKPFESRKKTFEAIMEALRGDNVKVVGICGMGGIGKSTMAEEIQQIAKREKIFDEVAVSVVSQNVKVSEIQSKLAGCLNLKILSEDDEWNTAARLKERFMQGKKILVVLDDVWGPVPLDLMRIGLDFPTAHNGCKILLTSRSPDVCRANNCLEPFEIEGLNPGEAWKLFKDTVGDLVDRRTEPIAQSVCRECGGLPLVIQAVASALKQKDLTSWKDAQRRFKNFTPQKIAGIDPKVFGLLKVSYDYLEDEEAKSCFLLCCLFPEDAVITIEKLTFYAEPMGFFEGLETIEEARERVGTLVGVLKSASLLLPDQEDPTYCRMHDVIRGVAISIASTEEKYKFLIRDGISSWPEIYSPESCKLISIRSANIDELPNILECPKLHTLVLDFTESSKPPLKLPETFLQRLKTELRVLNLYKVSLPLSVLSDLTNLRMLDMPLDELAVISMLKGLEKLEMLCLRARRMIKEIPLEFGQLKHLRLLDLRFCDDHVKLIPAGLLSSLSCLEELYIPTFGRWDLDDDDDETAATSSRDEGAARRKNALVVELSSLTHLTALATYFIKHGSIWILPDAKVFEKLIRYGIGVGDAPYGFEPSTKMLRLVDHDFVDGSNYGVLINLAERAEQLRLEKLKGLQKMFDRSSGEAFEDLKYLAIHDIQDLEHLTFFKSLSNLRRLVVSDCPKLKYLFCTSIAIGLLQLEELEVYRCDNMEEVIRTNYKDEELTGDVNHHMEELLSFPRLKSLTLWNLPKLESFYDGGGGGGSSGRTVREGVSDNDALIVNSLFDSKVSFPALETLDIRYLHNIGVIWENGSHVHELFCKLRELDVITSYNQVNMIPPTMLERLPNLKVEQLVW